MANAQANIDNIKQSLKETLECIQKTQARYTSTEEKRDKAEEYRDNADKQNKREEFDKYNQEIQDLDKRLDHLKDALKELNKSYSNQKNQTCEFYKEVNWMLDKNPAALQMLMSDNLNECTAKQIRTLISSKIASTTRQKIGKTFGYFLSGPILGSHGQSKSSIYMATTDLCGVLAAKVYGSAFEADYQREVAVNQVFQQENIVKFIADFRFEHRGGPMFAVVMPYLPLNVAELLRQQTALKSVTICRIASACYNALKHIHSKGFCYSDLKPENIMLKAEPIGWPVLVDFGATAKLGEDVVQCTQQYLLNRQYSKCSESMDWTCLGSTLAQLAGFNLVTYKSVERLVEAVNFQFQQEPLFSRLILACFEAQEKGESALATAVSAYLNKHTLQ